MKNSLYSLPDNWVWTTIDEISEKPQYGWTTKARVRGDIHLLRTTDITSGFIDWDSVPFCTENPKDIEKYLLHDNDVVISRAGSVGYSYLLKNPRKSVFASYLIRFKVKINPSYFQLFLQTPYYWHTISENKLGIVVPNVNATKIKNIHIPLAPLNEQVRIVGRFEELFSQLDVGLQSLQAAQTQLEHYRQTTLKQAYTGKLTQKWRTDVKSQPVSHDYPDFNYLSSDQISHEYPNYKEIPREWGLVYLKELSDIDVGHAFKSKKFTSNGIRLLRGKNIQPGKLVWDDTKYYPLSELEKFEHLLVNENDIILAMDRPVITSGLKLARAKSSDIPSLLVQRMARFKPRPELSSNYLYYALQLPDFIVHLLGGQTGTQLPHISKKNINSHIIPLPTIDEQKKIVKLIESSFSYLQNIQIQIEKSSRYCSLLKQGILMKAFKGRLIPQDPNDEPASLLLKRIKAQKVKQRKLM